MKKIAFALSIVLSISLMGCAATTTTTGVTPVPATAQTAKVADPVPAATQAQTHAVATAPVVSAGGWTTTNTWSGDKGITTDQFDANGEPILINMVTTSNIPFQIYVLDNTGNTVFVIDKVKANWGVDKKTSSLEGLKLSKYSFKIVTDGPWSINIQQKSNQNK